MENFQALCLVAGFGFCLAALVQSERDPPRVFVLGLALLFLTMFVLEVDTRKLEVPVLVMLFNGTVRNVWLGIVWLGAAVLFFRNMQPVWRVFAGWLRSRSGGLFIATGVFWVLGRISDKALLGSKDLFLEELMEVNAGVLMAEGAYLLRRLSARTDPDSRRTSGT